ncbi:hypothetical protein LTR94_033497, partial [Friedmanniomyces endolithicus]
MAAKGYPDSPLEGSIIRGADQDFGPHVQVFHAGTKLSDDQRVVTNGGDTHVFSKVDWELWLETTPTSSWPAQPGTYVIYLEREANDRQFWKIAVVGWMINLEGNVRPVVTDPDGVSKEWHVLHPDGRVEASDGGSWDN